MLWTKGSSWIRMTTMALVLLVFAQQTNCQGNDYSSSKEADVLPPTTTKSPPRTTTFKTTTTTLEPTTEEKVLQQWIQFQKSATGAVEVLIRKALPLVTQMSSVTEVSTECTSALLKLVFGLKGMKNWAVRMLDASGRPSAGILEGTLSDPGNIDECYATAYIDDYSRKEIFTGQYCAVNLVPVLPPKPFQVTFAQRVVDMSNVTAHDTVFMDFSKKASFFYRVKFRFGICVPSTCTTEDVQTIVAEVLKDTFLNSTVPFCQVQQDWEFNTLQIIILTLLACLVVVIIIGTLVASKYKSSDPNATEVDSSNSTLVRVLSCFSVDFSYRKLMDTNPVSSNAAKLESMDGVRVLSMLWIVLVHTYAFQHDKAVGKIMEIINFSKYISFGVVVNAWVSVDSFFVIGGALASYVTLRALEKNHGRFYPVRYVLRRIWRLSPCLLLANAVLFLLPLVDHGPNWSETIGMEVDTCYKKWWGSIFFLNSWMTFTNTCMVHTWYVSADIQLYFLAAIPVYALYKWPKLGVALCYFFIFVSMGIVGVMTYVYKLYPTIMFLTPDIEQMNLVGTMIYLRPFTHLAPYSVGLLLGYYLLNTPKKPLKMLTNLGAWLVALSLLMAVLLGAFNWHNGTNALPLESSIYAATHRAAWAVGLSWVIYACCTGNGGFINSFLCWKLFNILGRLTYLMYLIHMVAIWQRNASRRERFYIRHYDFIYEFFGNVMLAMSLGFVFHIMVECPFAALDKILFPAPKPPVAVTLPIPKSPVKEPKMKEQTIGNQNGSSSPVKASNNNADISSNGVGTSETVGTPKRNLQPYLVSSSLKATEEDDSLNNNNGTNGGIESSHM